MIYSSEFHRAGEFKDCGAKAYHLAKLKGAGFRCPPFLCMGKEDLEDLPLLINMLRKSGIHAPFSVRSSANLEDRADRSFAGQFSTFLNVSEEELEACMKKCFADVPKTAESSSIKMHVIVQHMLSVDLSGVFFTENPMGILSESVTVVGRGPGSNVVEDLVPTTTYYDNRTDSVSYHTSQPGAPLLPESARKELLSVQERLETVFGPGLDVEYALEGETLFFLQVRPITTLRHERQVTLDNSNIVESYPGLTFPLTADFVTRQYGNIFKGVMTRLSGSGRISKQYREVFDHMVACYNGRMYYRIDHWYGVIRFLPFSGKIIPVWQEMLGVQNGDVPDSPLHASFSQKISVAFHTCWYFFRSPAKMRQLNKNFLQIEKEFRELEKLPMNLKEIQAFYHKMETTVMGQWDYTLINDMYTFLHTGIFRWLMKKSGAKENDTQKLFSNISQLASLRPVKELLTLASEWEKSGENPEFQRHMEDYLDQYGDRSVGELKLETETFRETPSLLMEQIRQYAKMPGLEDLIKSLGKEKNEKEFYDYSDRHTSTPGHIPAPGRYFLRCARTGIENRELSRLNRSRLFGFARALFLRAGKILTEEGRLDTERDIFYLTMDEIFEKSDIVLRSLVLQRKALYESYAAYPAFSRVVFDGEVVQKPCLEHTLTTAGAEVELLHGTPCSPGKVTGPVLVVDDVLHMGGIPPTDGLSLTNGFPLTDGLPLTDSLSGKILVTRSTDPGWAFLLASAAGLISEQGSLLSHTAIISRELKIPALVGVRGAVSALKDGDMVELDCETGLVRRL